jgi:site-specific DNA-methyltransferase (adenine-specific)
MYKLYNNDCLNILENKDLVQNESVDLILCDLPYGVTSNKWDVIIDMDRLWKSYLRIIKPNGAILLNSQQPFTTALINAQPKLYRYEWIWLKNRATGFLNAKKMPLKAFEEILVFYKKLPTYNPQGLKKVGTRKLKKSNATPNYRAKGPFISGEYTGYPKNILEYPCVQKTNHPTQKPVELLEYLIKTYTNEDDLVLDNCMGSGSTGVAALKNHRRFIGIEQNEKYYGIACSRMCPD